VAWKPTNHASIASLVVPVLPYRSQRLSRAEARAPVPSRVTADSNWAVMKALRSLMAWRGSAGVACHSTWPCASLTLSMSCTAGTLPPVAKAL
jgi:hypothetical protein